MCLLIGLFVLGIACSENEELVRGENGPNCEIYNNIRYNAHTTDC